LADQKLTAIRVANPFVSPLKDDDLLYIVQDTGTTPQERAITGLELSGDLGPWRNVPGSPVRASNTTFTVTGDYSSVTAYPFGKNMVFRWKESGAIKCAMQSIPQTYGAPNTTFTIIGDPMASIDSGTLKYSTIPAGIILFSKAGTIGAVETNAFQQFTAKYPLRVIGADLDAGTAGTTNSTTVDVNKDGTTMFTTKPTLATTVQSSPTPFTADSGSSLAIGSKVTIDVDAFQTTAAIDLYIHLYVFPTRLLYLL